MPKIDDAHLGGTETCQLLCQPLLCNLEGSLTGGQLVEDMMEMVDTIRHLIILSDDMGHITFLATLLVRTSIPCRGIISQSTGLTHLLEDDAVHASAEILIEDCHRRGLIDIPIALLVVIHPHIDVLGIVGSNPHFIVISQQTLVVLVLRYSLQLLLRLVKFADDGRYLLDAQRSVVLHRMLITGQVLQQINEHLRICDL